MNRRRQLGLLILLMTTVSLIVAIFGIVLLYRSDLEEEKRNLSELTKNRATTIEALFCSSDKCELDQAILAKIIYKNPDWFTFNKNGQYFIVKRQKNEFISVFGKHYYVISWNESLSLPMRLALQGYSGILTEKNKDGQVFLVSYEYLEYLNLGLIAKIDLAEIKASFYQVVIYIFLSAIAINFVGAWLFWKSSQPLIQSLEKSEKHIRAILDTAPDAILTLNEQGMIESFNQAAAKIFGYDFERITGENITLLIPDFYQLVLPCKLEKSISQQIDTNLLGKRYDATNFFIDISISKVEIEKQKKIILVVRDISELVQQKSQLKKLNLELEIRVKERTKEFQEINTNLEKEIKERQHFQKILSHQIELLSRIMETSPVGILLIDLEGKIVLSNNRLQQILGLNREQINKVNYHNIKSKLRDYSGHPIADNQCPVKQAISTGKTIYNIRQVIESYDQQRLFLSINSAPLLTSEGNLQGVTLTLQDITGSVLSDLVRQELIDRNQALIEALGEIVYEKIPKEDTIYWEGNYNQLLGYSSEEMGRNIEDWLNLIHPEDLFQVKKKYQEYLRENPVITMEYRLRCKDGNYRWFYDRGVIRKKDEESEKIIGIILDITERKQAEAALKESEESYRRLIETANEGVWIIDAEGKTTFTNDKTSQMFGYTREEMLNFSIFDLTDKVWREQASSNIERRRQGIREQHDFKFYRKDGKEIWTMISTNPITDTSGNYIGALGLVTDITERVQIEEALRQSELKFRTFIHTAGIVIIVITSDHRILEWNEEAEKIYGKSREEVLGKDYFQVCLSNLENQIFVPNFSPNPLEPENKNFESAIHDKEGKERWLLWNVSPLLNDKEEEIGAIACGQDITERKQAEANLRESEQRFRQLVENINQVFWIQGTTPQELIYVSPAYEKIWGRSLKNLYQNPTSWFYTISREDRLRMIVAIKKLKREKSFSETIRILQPDNSVRWIVVHASTIHNDEGKVIRNVGICEDITYQMEAEKALQNANRRLADWVGELEQTNQDMALLKEMIDFLQSCLNIDEAYTMVGDLLKPMFSDCCGSLFHLNNSNNLLEMVTQWGENIGTETIFTPNQCWALRRSRVHQARLKQPKLFCQHLIQPYPIESLCIPLMGQGRVLGLLYLCSREADKLTPRKQSLAQTVSEHIALALSNLELRDRLHQQSIRDPLTGLFNRRYMEESLEREIQKARRNKSPLSVIMIDIDHFKQFNDLYGHDIGDAVLEELGLYLNKNIRGGDIACRYGGEELMLILPDASLENSLQRAQQLRQGIKNIQVQHKGESVGTITASFGIGCFPEHGQTGEQIIKAADIALFCAKREGRDRVVLSNPLSP